MPKNRPGILLVEDDPFLGKAFEDNLSAFGGFQVFRAETVKQALGFATENSALRFIYLDIAIKNYEPYTDQETQNGKLAGLTLMRDFEELLPKAKIYVKSTSPSPELIEYIQRHKSVIGLMRRVSDWKDIEHKAKGVYSEEGMRPEILIVHGHDSLTLQALQQFIEHKLKLGVAKVLKNLPNQGNTVIEKFEHYARQVDLVFALMTDDDVSGENRRARQNVIFEIGYFTAAFGRKSGRLIILKKNDIEIPSDMAGILLIDVSKGFEEEKFRHELQGWWGLAGD